MCALRADRGRTVGPMEYRVRLRTPAELFSVSDPDLRSPEARLQPGIDQLIDELMSVRSKPDLRIVVSVPPGAGEGWSDGQLPEAIHRYCALRFAQNDRQIRTLRREGLGGLRFGVFLFGAGAILSYVLTRPDIPDLWQAVLGNGVFLVIAWIGVTNPLDTLIFSRRHLVMQQQTLRYLAGADAVVVEE